MITSKKLSKCIPDGDVVFSRVVDVVVVAVVVVVIVAVDNAVPDVVDDVVDEVSVALIAKLPLLVKGEKVCV